MKSILLFLLLLPTVFAQDLSRMDCLESARLHGGLNTIDDQCFEVLKMEGDLHLISESYQVRLTGHILWVDQYDHRIRKIAGDKTAIEDVFSIILDEVQEVVIFLKHSEKGVTIFAHHLKSNGNISPFVIGTFSELNAGMSYSYDQDTSTLFVMNDEQMHSVKRFEWSSELIRLGRAKIVEIKDLTNNSVGN